MALFSGRDTGYRLFANGALGASLEKTGADYRFERRGLLVELQRRQDGARQRPEGYPFTGTIERLEIYAGALPTRSWPPAPHRRSAGTPSCFMRGTRRARRISASCFVNTPLTDADRRGGRQFLAAAGFGRKHRYRIAAQAQRGRIRGDGGLAGCVRAGCDAHAGLCG